MLVPLI